MATIATANSVNITYVEPLTGNPHEEIMTLLMRLSDEGQIEQLKGGYPIKWFGRLI